MGWTCSRPVGGQHGSVAGLPNRPVETRKSEHPHGHSRTFQGVRRVQDALIIWEVSVYLPLLKACFSSPEPSLTSRTPACPVTTLAHKHPVPLQLLTAGDKVAYCIPLHTWMKRQYGAVTQLPDMCAKPRSCHGFPLRQPPPEQAGLAQKGSEQAGESASVTSPAF